MWCPDETDITENYFYKRKVIVCQPKKGYRFSIDAPILADFLPFAPSQKALEIGTGSGIVALLALYQNKFATIYGVEIQETLSHLASLNAKKNGYTENLTVITRDFKEIYQDFSGIHHIFANPPYFETHRGHLSPNAEIRDAKSETRLTLKELLRYTHAILDRNGTLDLILPYARYKETMDSAAKIGFSPTRLREVFSFKDGKPERFLVQLSSNTLSLEKLPPLIVFKEKGVYTEEMDKILTG